MRNDKLDKDEIDLLLKTGATELFASKEDEEVEYSEEMIDKLLDRDFQSSTDDVRLLLP